MFIVVPFFLKNKIIPIIKRANMEIADYNFVDSGLKIWFEKKYKKKQTRHF